MQIELWLALLIGIFAMGIITWYGTNRTIREIHEDTNRTIEAMRENTMRLISTIHDDIKASQAKIETKLEGKTEE